MKTVKESLQNLTDEQLRGAEWAFRFVLTSPALRGQARAAVHECVTEARDVMAERNALMPPEKPKRQRRAKSSLSNFKLESSVRGIKRTKAEVLADQRSVVGCCEAYANRMSCSCLEDAEGTTGCGICNDPNCRNPGGKH